MRISSHLFTLKSCLFLVGAACTLCGAARDQLYRGWLAMSDLNFQDAHQRISLWEAAHPGSAMDLRRRRRRISLQSSRGWAFLESELFVGNDRFRNRERRSPDPEGVSPGDVDALLPESIALRLRADLGSQ